MEYVSDERKLGNICIAMKNLNLLKEGIHKFESRKSKINNKIMKIMKLFNGKKREV